VIAPELFLCGYPPRDLLLRPDFIEANLAILPAVAGKVGPVPLCVGFVDKNATLPGRALANAAAVLQNGKIIWRQHKSLLPTYDVFDEDRYFEPARSVAPFAFNGRKIAITICEDIWNDEDFWSDRLYRRDPVKELIAQGADLILNISASPWHAGKERTRLAMLQRVARDEKVSLVQVNLVGANDELIFDGHSVALNRQGEVLALGKGFAEDVFVTEVDGDAPPIKGAWPVPEEQLFRALSLGIRDYRQTFLKPYRVIYRIVGQRVYVYLIVDGRRDMEALLARRLLET
jgi:predicted amidohydrolase